MLKSEFTARTGFTPTDKIYKEIERQYMASDLDKDAFCKQWLRKGGIKKASAQMVQDIEALLRYCQGVNFLDIKRDFKPRFNDLIAELRQKYISG